MAPRTLLDELAARAVAFIDRRGGAGMRRGGRGRGSTGRKASLLPTVLPIFAGGSVFLADKHLVDGVSGKIYAFQDQIDPTHYLMQATSSKQVAIPQGWSGMKGAPVAQFTGAQCYVSTRGVAAWKFMHDGTGCHWTAVFARSTRVAGPRLMATSGNSPGWDVLPDTPALDDIRFRTWGGAFANVGVMAATGALGAVDTPTHISGFYKESIAPAEMGIFNRGTLAASGNSLLAPSTANPTNSFTLGSNANGTADFIQMRWRATLIAAPGKILTAQERATLFAWIQQDAGIAP